MREIRTLKRGGKRIFPRCQGDRTLSEVEGDARGAEPLWKFVEQIWVQGRRPESLLLRFISSKVCRSCLINGDRDRSIKKIEIVVSEEKGETIRERIIGIISRLFDKKLDGEL